MPAKLPLPPEGSVFNAWTFLGPGKPRKRWVCLCVCGTMREPLSCHIKSGASKSCGCVPPEPHRTHGRSVGSDTLYSAWRNIKQRCFTPKNKHYHRYGGRGIKLFVGWVSDFAAFAAYMGEPPSMQHSVDRRKNSGNYEPGNVKWSTPQEQALNTRRNHIITIAGVSKTRSVWCHENGVCQLLAGARINRLGWDPVRAVTQVARPDKRTESKK